MSKKYFYIKSSICYNYENRNRYKYGVSDNPKKRLLNSTDIPALVSYLKLYEIEYSEFYNNNIGIKSIDDIISIYSRDNDYNKKISEHFNLNYFNKISSYLVNENPSSTEFIYEEGLEILINIITIDFKKIGLNLKEISYNPDDYIHKEEDSKTLNKITPLNLLLSSLNKETKKLRYYQNEIVIFITNYLSSTNNKIFLELATGGGKTIISYHIFNYFKPKFILILSPRTKIKEQNKDEEYLNIFNDKKDYYNTHIISDTYQNHNNIYKYIIKNDIKEIFVWFDEAHWGLMSWILKNPDNKVKEFFLRDNTRIQKRLFTSASPNKNYIKSNYDYFGDLYSPIKVSKLIEQKWLCPIIVNIYDMEVKLNDIQSVEFIINTHNRKNKKQGFSFHSNCKNAFILFEYHLQLFNENKTNIKPFLLIDNNNKEIKEKVKIDKIEEFEKEKIAIGYVVGKFNMGYNNRKIDIIYFTDYKTSYEDIIQTIGRGTRIDPDDINKQLDIILHTNKNNDVDDNYINIKNTLRYLILDVELKITNFFIFKITKNKEKSIKISNGDGALSSIIIEENKDITSLPNDMILNLYKEFYNNWDYDKLINYLETNDIHTYNDYYEYHEKYLTLNIPEPSILFKKYKEFKFIDTYNKIEQKTFTSKEECIKIIIDKKKELLKFTKKKDKINYLKTIINIPKEQYNLYYFYGGKEEDFPI